MHSNRRQFRLDAMGDGAEKPSWLQAAVVFAVVIAVLGGATALMDDGTHPGSNAKAAVEPQRTGDGYRR